MRFLRRKRQAHRAEVDHILELLPGLRAIAYQAWEETQGIKGFRRLRHFLIIWIVLALTDQQAVPPEANQSNST
ncbi:MAG: hypothetical protein HC880_10075 [Bacteroidia bacterium]|nr:hypothetical protein [Bacteroidia bacterium]